MVKSKLVTIEDIKKNNPRLCLNPLRYFGECFKCPQYISKDGYKCESRIENPKGEKEFNAKIDEQKRLRQRLKDLKEEIKKIEGGVR